VNWFKRYVVSCLIAAIFFAAMDSYNHPDKGARYDSVLVLSASWPIWAALIVGDSIGDALCAMKSVKTE
jgi:hypothetical protein